jgi:hypothetical protein
MADGGVWVKVFPTEEELTPNATGGDEVKEVGGYRYHLFTNSGDLDALDKGEYEILIVGAGGGGGWGRGGGGGGGAVEPASGYTKQTLIPGTYTVTIADGGSAGASGVEGGTPSATSFAGASTIAAAGGGGGASSNNGSPGGSGGGAKDGDRTGGAAIGSNTNPGGDGLGGGAGGGAGGGGATDKGDDYSNGAAGNGGQGLALADIDAALTSSNFTTFSGKTHVASGAGGGAIDSPGGTGGTGAGNGASNGSAPGGTATSFGCGGGGGGQNGGAFSNAGKGYQGLVIVRYAL